MCQLCRKSSTSFSTKIQIVLYRLLAHLNRLSVALDDHVLVYFESVLYQRQDYTPDSRNLPHRRHFNGVVLARINLAAHALLHAADARRLGGQVALNMLADPDVAVDTQQHINLATTVVGIHGPLLPLGPHDARTAARAGDTDEDAVAQLAVLETAGVQAGGAVLVQLLDLGDEQVALGEEAADLQLVRLGALAEDAAGQVDGRDLQHGELRGGDVDAPPLGLHLDDAADDEVADFWGVARAERLDGKELVGLGEGACEGGCDGCAVCWDVGAVTAVIIV